MEVCLRECGEKLICNPFLLHKREEGASTRSMSITIEEHVVSGRT